MTAPALRIAQLVRLLDSDRDGEVVSAARVLGKTLREVGLDFHDLAAAAERLRPTTSSSRPEWQTLAGEILRRGGRGLKPAERTFLESMARWSTQPSARQQTWLDALATATGARRAAA